jgi:hypothetical protein
LVPVTFDPAVMVPSAQKSPSDSILCLVVAVGLVGVGLYPNKTFPDPSDVDCGVICACADVKAESTKPIIRKGLRKRARHMENSFLDMMPQNYAKIIYKTSMKCGVLANKG